MVVFPESVIPNGMTINLKANSKKFTSSLNGSMNTVGFQGAKWVVSLSFDSIDNFSLKEIDILQSFVWSLQGMNGRFKMPNFQKMGSPSVGVPLVDGWSNSGTIMESKGWKPQRHVLNKGDFIEFNNELHMIESDVFSDISGNASLNIMPPIRKIPDDSTVIVTEKPMGVFMLADDDQGNFDIQNKFEGTLSLNVVEAISYV